MNTTRSLPRFALAIAIMLALAALISPAHALAVVHYAVSSPFVESCLGGSALSAGLLGPVIALTQQQILSASKPGNSDTRAVRTMLYDTQPYVSTATVSLDFFGAINADKSLSNAKGNGGTFPNGQAFLPMTMGVDILTRVTSSATLAGAMDDIAQLVMSGRGYAVIKIGQFTLPEIPIRALHGSGGPFGSMSYTNTAPLGMQAATNGVQDGGYDIRGSFIITSDTPVSVSLKWPAALTLNTTPLNICFWFNGDWQFPNQ